MDFARQQRDPTRHLVGITAVILVHVLVVYALVTGLGKKAIEVIKKPLTATIVEEIKAPPPPPPPPPKKLEIQKAPPPPEMPYVPPPDVPVPTVPQEPVIAAVAPTPPPAPPVIAPPAPPAPPQPEVRRGITRIEGDPPIYPREAIKAGVASGKVVARLKIDEKGNVTEVQIMDSRPPRVFDREVVRALSQWKFKPDGERYIGEVEVNFTLKEG